MKKIFTIALVAFALFAVTSCGPSIKEKAEYFETELVKASDERDIEKFSKIQDEMEEYEKTLSEADKKEFTMARAEVNDKLRGK